MIFLAILSVGLLACHACESPEQGYIIPDPSPVVTPGKQEVNNLPGKLTNQVYSISSGPGVDASNEICVSWAANIGISGTQVLYTTLSDALWRDARAVSPEQEYVCSAFKGIASVDAGGNDITEYAEFSKCGATLSSLKPDTEYKFVIRTEAGERSREYRFRTAGAEQWSCCLISDFHSYPPLQKRMTSAMGIIDTIESIDGSLDWILSAGDVVAWGGSYSFWREFFEQDNCSEYLWARANGNHDNWTKESQQTGNYDIPNDFFKGTSYYPQNGYPGEERVCYHFRYGNTLFVMLNTEDMESGAEFNSAANWLEKVVTDERKGSDPPLFTVVCMHYEWFYGTNGKSSEYSRWHSLFDKLGVDLAYAGNNHVYLRSFPIYNGKAVSSQSGRGTVYLQTPSSDNDRGRSIDESSFSNKDLIDFRWTEGSHTVGAVHMDVDNVRMILTLYDRNGNPIDSTTIYPK